MCDVEGGSSSSAEGGGIAVVEDCAQAAGAQRDGRRAGAFGEAAALSFYPTENLAAVGDGGAVVTASAIDERVRALRQYGWSEKYRADIPQGWNSRLDELQAAVLRVGSHVSTSATARAAGGRPAICGRAPEPPGRFVWNDGEDFVGHLAVILAGDRDHVRAALDAAEIGTDVHYPVADYEQPAWRADVRLPVTEHAVEHVLTVPCYPELTDSEVDRVAGAP